MEKYKYIFLIDKNKKVQIINNSKHDYFDFVDCSTEKILKIKDFSIID